MLEEIGLKPERAELVHVSSDDSPEQLDALVRAAVERIGAQALGIRNVLCTTGTHQTLGPYSAAKNVFDLDSVQRMQVLADLAANGSVVGEERIENEGLCLGGTAAPFADPLVMQVARTAKKASAGAAFLITQQVYDLARFGTWWSAVTDQGLHEQVAFIAGVSPLVSAASAREESERRPWSRSHCRSSSTCFHGTGTEAQWDRRSPKPPRSWACWRSCPSRTRRTELIQRTRGRSPGRPTQASPRSCGRCTPCREGTKQMSLILTRIRDGKGTPEDLALLERLSQTMKAASSCGLGNMAPNPVLNAMQHSPEEFQAHLGGNCPAGTCREGAAAR